MRVATLQTGTRTDFPHALLFRQQGRGTAATCRGRTGLRQGAATVEFALVATVLFLLVFGGIEITRISMLQHTVDHAAYTAARDAIIPGADTAAVKRTAEEHLAAIGVTGATVRVSPDPIAEDTSAVEVTVSIPVAGNSLVVPQFVAGNLTGRCLLLTERSPMEMSAAVKREAEQRKREEQKKKQEERKKKEQQGGNKNDNKGDQRKPSPPPARRPPPPPPPPPPML